MSLCLTCSPNNMIKATSTKRAQWLDKMGRKSAVPYNHPSIRVGAYAPGSATVQIRVKVTAPSERRKKILFCAANPLHVKDAAKFKTAPEAYGNYENMGVAYVEKSGFVTIRLMAPQPYLEEGRLWPPHFHFCYANKKAWSQRVFAVAAFPGHHGKKYKGRHEYEMTCIGRASDKCSILTPSQVRRHWGKLIVINALPGSDDDERVTLRYKLDDQLRLPYNKRLTPEEKRLTKEVIGNRPYVVFCAHSKCSAASKVIMKLVKLGCNNVYYMPEGIRGF